MKEQQKKKPKISKVEASFASYRVTYKNVSIFRLFLSTYGVETPF
jgi:hypothetical protein